MAANYRTIQGDAWDAIAYRLWGKEHLMHLLMAANPAHMDVLIFPAGVELVVPDLPATALTTSTAELPPWIRSEGRGA